MSRQGRQGRQGRRAMEGRPGRGLVRAALLAGLALPVLGPSLAQAAEFYARPRQSLVYGYDDNVGFDSESGVSTYQLTATPGVTLGARSPVLDLRLDARADLVRYPDEPALDSNDQFISTTNRYIGKRYVLNLNARYDRDTSRDDDLDESGQRLIDNERRQTFGFDPSIVYSVSPSNTLQVSAGYRNRRYPTLNEKGDGLNDIEIFTVQNLLTGEVASSGDTIEQTSPFQGFSQYNAAATWIHKLTPRTDVGGGPSALYYTSNRQDVTLGSLQGYVQHQLTPRFKLDARVGPSLIYTETREQGEFTSEQFQIGQFVFQQISSEVDESTTLTPGYTADAGILWDVTPRTRTQLRYSRNVEPFGSGAAAVNRDFLRFNIDHDLTRTVRLFATATLQLDTSTDDQDEEFNDRTSTRFEPGVRWAITDELDLSLRYRWRYQRIDSQSGGDYTDVASNAVFVRLDLQLPELRTAW